MKQKLNGNKMTKLLVCRLDGRVISVRNSKYYQNSYATTFDMVTEEKLACADVFADKDTAEVVIAENWLRR